MALDETASYRFGRADDCSWVFSDDRVSRLHGRLDHTNDRWAFRDLSTNGTFVLDRSVTSDGDPREFSRRLDQNESFYPEVGDTLLLGSKNDRLVFVERVKEPVLQVQGNSAATRALEQEISLAARHDLPIVLIGPTGSGKTWAARAIHFARQEDRPFISINCGRLSADRTVLQSELLGHVQGAFTGALSAREGKLWAADGGTLFLDEVESLPRIVQDFLIDILEETGDPSPLGAAPRTVTKRPRFRLVSATKQPLLDCDLRTDLTQRLLAGEVIRIPTLEDRREDIPRFVSVFATRTGEAFGLTVNVTPEALELLSRRPWPGQLRELEATVRAVVTREIIGRRQNGEDPKAVHLGATKFAEYAERRSAALGEEGSSKKSQTAMMRALSIDVRRRPRDISREDAERALAEHHNNKTHAAEALGIAVNTLKKLLKG